jgi:hypothetical protein
LQAVSLFAEDPEVAAVLGHLRDAELPGFEIDDKVGAVRLRIKKMKNPALRLEAAILDFIGHWSLEDRKDQPRNTRGWWAAWRNWCNNAVKFGNWYAVAGPGKASEHADAGENRVATGKPTVKRPASQPVTTSEVVKGELAKMKRLVGDQ